MWAHSNVGKLQCGRTPMWTHSNVCALQCGRTPMFSVDEFMHDEFMHDEFVKGELYLLAGRIHQGRTGYSHRTNSSWENWVFSVDEFMHDEFINRERPAAPAAASRRQRDGRPPRTPQHPPRDGFSLLNPTRTLKLYQLLGNKRRNSKRKGGYQPPPSPMYGWCPPGPIG